MSVLCNIVMQREPTSAHPSTPAQSTHVSLTAEAVSEKTELEDGGLILHPQKSHRFASFQPYLASKCPRLHRSLQKILLYIRGPKPKIDLPSEPSPRLTSLSLSHIRIPDPIPLLGRTYNFRGHTFTIALEPVILRLTRPFTAPWLFITLVAAYIIGFAFFTRAQWFLTPSSSFVDCTSVFWTENAGCGLNGELCSPFTNTSFDLRCPAQCGSVVLQNPRLVGDIELDFVPLLVGGGDMQKTYRGDSFICSSAIQA